MGLTRRLLLGTAGLTAIGAAVYGGSRFACRYVPRHHPGFFALLDAAPDDPAAREIGRLALVGDALPATLAGLEGALSDRPSIRAAMAETCPAARARLVRDQCAMDFAAGRTLRLDGWILSETEAAICAGRVLRDAA